MVGELFAQYLATWHITPLGLLAKVVIVLLVVGCLSFGNCFSIGGEFCLMGLVWDEGFGKVDAGDLGGRYLVVLVVFAFPFITVF
jgi:hypothetical protein